ncbi:neutral zinc metallopeptidase [Dactylosporangium aurantiacum]|uniref:Neutral zinc metallopeptidase n=1 Tax=Dactylosporangium aurantiacum TaxID=35754 RepID=A0A9Q9MEM3_9ACTN|nr:neutral zinc metallopeptidase [Dactylosporangium aurantiacum]MDG6109761.1 neutral zinc metallopeptidase [Dactylosporangium aurantiacum]UWZ56303.1 neutral zinc metallopeptidase [Dactylosporangium aurantiacum]
MNRTPLFASLCCTVFLLVAGGPAAAAPADPPPFWAPRIPSLPVPAPAPSAAPAYVPPSYSPPPPSSSAPSYSSSDSSFASDVSIALRVVERYWSSRIVGFRPVSRVVPYRIDGELMCGSQPIPTQNAAYCPVGDFIAYDVNWSEEVYQDLGDAFVFYLLGHEYGHAVQQRLGINYAFTIQQELQADCFAGAYIGDSIKVGDFTLEDGDLDELRSGLLSVADPDDEPWFKEGAHGSAAQRTGAFFDGYEQSLDACDMPATYHG